MSSGIVYLALQSLKEHLESVWGGDVYTKEGGLTKIGFCPPGLEHIFTYTDSEGNERIFGPSKVVIGRLLEDTLNLPKNRRVISAFIELLENDIENASDWRHSIQPKDTPGNVDREGLMFVGGGHMMYRRVTVSMTINFLEARISESEASRLGSAALSFLETLVTSDYPKDWTWKMLGADGNVLKDAFGEYIWRSTANVSHAYRRGGPPDSWIYDLKIFVELACTKE